MHVCGIIDGARRSARASAWISPSNTTRRCGGFARELGAPRRSRVAASTVNRRPRVIHARARGAAARPSWSQAARDRGCEAADMRPASPAEDRDPRSRRRRIGDALPKASMRALTKQPTGVTDRQASVAASVRGRYREVETWPTATSMRRSRSATALIRAPAGRRSTRARRASPCRPGAVVRGAPPPWRRTAGRAASIAASFDRPRTPSQAHSDASHAAGSTTADLGQASIASCLDLPPRRRLRNRPIRRRARPRRTGPRSLPREARRGRRS